MSHMAMPRLNSRPDIESACSSPHLLSPVGLSAGTWSLATPDRGVGDAIPARPELVAGGALLALRAVDALGRAILAVLAEGAAGGKWGWE